MQFVNEFSLLSLMLSHHEGHLTYGMGSLKVATPCPSCRFQGSIKAVSMLLQTHLWDGDLSRWCFAGLLAGQRLRRSSQRLASICRRPSSSHAAFSGFLVLAGSVVLPVCFNCIRTLQSSLLLGLLRQHPGIHLKGRLHGHTCIFSQHPACVSRELLLPAAWQEIGEEPAWSHMSF